MVDKAEQQPSSFAEEEYFAKVLRMYKCRNDGSFSESSTVDPKIYYIDSDGELPIDSALALIQRAEEDLKPMNHAVCIIENISPALIGELGIGWKIAPQFFARHVQSPQQGRRANFWKPQLPRQLNPDKEVSLTSGNLSGMFEYHGWQPGTSELSSKLNYIPRDCFYQHPYPIQSNT